ncbi:hypothetical protein, partial [Thermococcus sp. JdF3]
YLKIQNHILQSLGNININNTQVQINVPGKQVTIYTHEILDNAKKALEEQLIPKIEGSTILRETLLDIIPRFVYLDQEMELKGTIKKTKDSWRETFKEYSKTDSEYLINYRLFSILPQFKIEDLDRLELGEARNKLENALIRFSRELINTYWSQERVRIDGINVAENEINLYIRDIDDNGDPIQSTIPERRSRGFKWHLAYLITIEYMRKLQ